MGCFGDKTVEQSDNVEMSNGNGNDGAEKGGKYGCARKFNPEFSGPIKNRSCTDIVCCIVFMLYIAGMIIIGIVAYVTGDPIKLLNPTDSQGNICGTGDVKDKPYLFFFDLTDCLPSVLDLDVTKILQIKSCPTYQVCVESCPSVNKVGMTASTSDLICKYGVDPAQKQSAGVSRKDLIYSEKLCAPYYLKSTAILKRCIPTVIGSELTSFLSSNAILSQDGEHNITTEQVEKGNVAAAALTSLQNIGNKVIDDVQDSWHWILGGLGIAMVASFLYIIIMRWVAGLMVWVTTYAVITLFGYATYYCYNEYDRLKQQDSNQSLQFEFTTNLSTYQDRKETWLVLGCISGVILLVMMLLLLALRNRIRLAIQLIKESSKAITCMLSTLFFPILPWIMQLILFAWFVAVLVFLVTSGKTQFKVVTNSSVTTNICNKAEAAAQFVGSSFNSSCNFEKYVTDNNLLRMQIFHLFGWFWLMNFIIAFGQCVLAGAFASWYWAFDKKHDVPSLPLIASIGRTLRYHTGSLAFGALIIAIVQIIRAGLEYLDHKLRGNGQEPGPVVNFIIKCLKCCFWCLEKFLKILNKNAYIEIAVYGKNFCSSAKNAFFLLMRNILRVAVLDKVTDFLLLLGKLSITAGVAIGSFFWFKRDENLNYYLAPVLIDTIGAYVIATAFFSVYEMAIDTIFLSFLEDCERHDGSPEKPYFMSKKLKKILGKKNRKPDDDDDD